MKILHVTPHLGGGVGKAHAAISGVLPKEVEQTFVLLEQPRDRRYLNMIEAAGARVVIAKDLACVADLAIQSDIVQFEFWNHPRLFECLARCAFPTMRSLFWSHVSGLSKPVIQPGLIEQAGRFVFTTQASFSSRSVASLSAASQRKIAVINSGFGFADAPQREHPQHGKPVIAYLGTVDFVKMHPGFFDVVDRLDGNDICVSVWGAVDPAGAVAARARAMRHPERIIFMLETANPAIALSHADIFFYPLQPHHYGTAENALIEAMSLGLVPVVLNNPAEMAIVRDGETGFIARSIEEGTSLLQRLLASPELRQRVSRNAVRYVAQTRTPAGAAQEFLRLWRKLLDEPAKHCDFRSVVGNSPADWFVATQCLPGAARELPQVERPGIAAKGTLTHFECVFAGDDSFSRLRM
jgi:glycosyltransferase involved in cell wall biosynthesis